MTGEQLAADIYIGPTYYMRLKHMVKDKINYRARGPNTALTRQPVQGRANDGGLRIGEMERDGVLAHGMSYFLNESFMIRGEKSEYYIAVCNKTGAISIYNEAKNLFLSPYADGPIEFLTNPDGTQNIKNLSRFGRSFSILRVPYSLKLLIQELQIMNVQMRIITDENVDQLLSMSYSNNINKLLKNNKEVSETIKDYGLEVNKILNIPHKIINELPVPELPEPVILDSSENLQVTPELSRPIAGPQTPPGSPPQIPPPQTPPGSPPQSSPSFAPISYSSSPSPPNTPYAATNSPTYAATNSPPYAATNSPTYAATNSPPYAATNSPEQISFTPIQNNSPQEQLKPSILEVDKSKDIIEGDNSESTDVKKIIQIDDPNKETSLEETKKITL
jgi:hypothetical protein